MEVKKRKKTVKNRKKSKKRKKSEKKKNLKKLQKKLKAKEEEVEYNIIKDMKSVNWLFSFICLKIIFY